MVGDPHWRRDALLGPGEPEFSCRGNSGGPEPIDDQFTATLQVAVDGAEAQLESCSAPAPDEGGDKRPHSVSSSGTRSRLVGALGHGAWPGTPEDPETGSALGPRDPATGAAGRGGSGEAMRLATVDPRACAREGFVGREGRRHG
jgi:hypothetical protein